MAETESTERGFGTGLRAKLGGTNGSEPEAPAPRSPAEAIAAATPADFSDVESLRAELSASLAREQELRASLSQQIDDFGTGAAEAALVAERIAELDRRAAALSATEAALEEREREVAARLDEISDTEVRVTDMQDKLAQAEARIGEREQLIEMKVRELKTADEERAKSAGGLAEQISTIAAREKELAKAEAMATGKLEEMERKQQKLEERLTARE